ncbi:MAG: hypothetical protein AAF985_00900 [Bacteroidota bacterium]
MEAKKILIMQWLSLLFLFYACTNPTANSQQPVPKTPAVQDTTTNVVSVGEYFVQFSLNQKEQTYQIIWGNEEYTNTSENVYDVLGSGMLFPIITDTTAIVLQQSCGTSCRYAVVLPFLKGSPEHRYDNVLAYDSTSRYIAFLSYGQRPEVHINEYVNNISKEQLTDLVFCPAALAIECIDTCFFSNGTFSLNWQGDKWKRGQPDLRTITKSIR